MPPTAHSKSLLLFFAWMLLYVSIMVFNPVAALSQDDCSRREVNLPPLFLEQVNSASRSAHSFSKLFNTPV